jgi:4-amino-4-deoxy-L-arabinose transferase-like glycosyltransferase
VHARERATDLAPFDRRVFFVAAVVLALLMALAARYGWHRDELYFLQCARHLAASYVDQPVLTPLIARLSLALFGRSLVGLRLFPALAAAGTVVVGGLLARELGGRRTAQLLAAVGSATAGVVLAADHLHGPTAFDLLAWAAFALFVIRLGRTGDPRWWVPAGAVAGLGLANKHSVGFFVAAVLLGMALFGERRLFRSRWFLAGAAIVVVCTLPDIIWQAGHQWATIDMTRRLNQKYGGLGGFAVFLPQQLVMVSPAMIGVWIAGFFALWRAQGPVRRSLAFAYVLLFVFFGLTGGKHAYYVAALYLVLLAAGAVVLEERAGALARHRTLLVWTAVLTLVGLPIELPVLPSSAIGWTAAVNPVLAETVGWPDLLRTVSGVWHSLPADERAHAVIFTADYGEAGAINELGGKYGLPTAVSGQNNFWWWGPGNPRATTVVAVAPGPKDTHNYDAYLRQFFGDVATVARIDNREHVDNEERGGHVYVCHRPVQPWGQLWSRLQHYD